MVNIADDYVLKPGERPVPIVWMTAAVELPRIPDVSDVVLNEVFGPGRSRKIKSWGHNNVGAHWLVTRGGTLFHNDLTYSRYTHHLLLRNDGWRIRGMADESSRWHPPMVTGVVYCLDTHSPHQVIWDERLDKTGVGYKAQIAVDRDEPMNPADAWTALATKLRGSPAKDAEGGVSRLAPVLRF